MQRPPIKPGDLPQRAIETLTLLRERRPRIHCITNNVAQNFTANVLLAAGCAPSMTISPEEIGVFVKSADGLLVNLGTFDRERREAVDTAVTVASESGVSWVLDPVLIDRSPERAKYARTLVNAVPKAIRLNAAEFTTLSGRGAESEAAADFARGYGAVVALSGATDFVSDGSRSLSIANGHPMMAKITAMGCAASALVAACIAVEPDALVGTAAGLLMLGVAGDIAARDAKGPGSFAVAIVDALHTIDGTAIVRHARVN
jgi:hydroxyethylthiazole kinase